MSQLESTLAEFETTLSYFAGEFSNTPAERSVRAGNLSKLDLSLGMVALNFQYLSPAAQLARFEFMQEHEMLAHGNPSGLINTYTKDHNLAAYTYDRSSGLILVNRFGFPAGETRPLKLSELEGLAFTIATKGIANLYYENRVLLKPGINRLTADLRSIF